MSAGRPFRVLHVIGGSNFGGIIPYVASLVRMAREHGGDGAVLATAPRVVDYYRERGIEVVPIHGIDRAMNPARDLLGLTRLLRHLGAHPYDIVHTHTSKGGIIGRLAARLARVPLVIHTTQGYAFTDYATNPLTATAFLWAERLATRWCDALIAVNEADRIKAVEYGVVAAEDILTIPNGIDLPAADAAMGAGPLPLAELGLEPGRPVVGAIGRLFPQKGLEHFIDAIPAIRTGWTEAQFLIVGGGELEAALKRRAAGRGSDVAFAGFRSDAYRVLQSIDLFVMPSLWEGMPLMLLEAMAAGRAIVATRIKGIIDVCEAVSEAADVAVLVEPGDAAALARAVLSLAADPARRAQLGVNARSRIESHYSDTIMKARTWRVYEAVARNRGIRL
jgi:glycosyltransferase involved in cell wall biosynthesis